MDHNIQKTPLVSGEEVVHEGLILTPPDEDHWELGSGLASARFGGADLNPSGDWTLFKPQDEAQSRAGFDTEGCALFGTLKAWIVLASYLGFTDFTKDASERYTGVFAGTTRTGTDPHVVAEVTRTTAGLIPQSIMPWDTDVDTFEEYYNAQMAKSLLPLGSKLLDRYTFGHEWVIPFGSSLTPQEKQVRIQAALKRGTVCVSLDGNYQYHNGSLTKPVGGQDSHWVLMLKHDGTHGTIHDQYIPFVKTLDKNYDHQAAKVYFLQKKTETAPRSFWDIIWDNFSALWLKKS